MTKFNKNDKTLTPYSKKSAPVSTDTVLVRRNTHVDTVDEDSPRIHDTNDGLGRQIKYEAKLILTPIKVPSRQSTADMALKTKRVVTTDDEVESLSTFFRKMLTFTSVNIKEEEKSEDDCISKTDSTDLNKKNSDTLDQVASCGNSKPKKQYGRRTETICVGPTSKQVTVTRSCRVA
eukprot:CAMPEP_0198138706 /NCGR_PEP_ID=MMETSP1443-20131203/2112_1 /TAXON_ID=186043 /ORGANISM="Entomoneis sp., Strain CCMP2396" /LENGTH=176 /DNA_ID=CAMNT_0043800603 /DNA_START=123 /DNA_END=650 /DNA_ORIENTATION=+